MTLDKTSTLAVIGAGSAAKALPQRLDFKDLVSAFMTLILPRLNRSGRAGAFALPSTRKTSSR